MSFRHLANARALAIALTLPLAAACRSDDGPIDPPDLSNNHGIFARYIAVGTSISAGFQSGGINASTQALAFPVLIAQKAGANFTYPAFQGRGCPAPLIRNAPPARLGGQGEGSCDLRASPAPAYLNNLAVPGIEVLDVFSNTATPLSTFEKLTTFILGGRTEVQALMASDPTFVTVEIGANDVLGGLLASDNPGNPDSITPTDVFAARYIQLLDSVEKTGAKVVLISVPDVTSLPYASTGSAYWCIKNQPACGITTPVPLPLTFTVSNNCAPAASGIPGVKGDSILVPWVIGIARVLEAAQGAVRALDCSVDTDVVTPDEYKNLRDITAADNVVVHDEAVARGWGYVDGNAIFAELQGTGAIPPFPDLSGAATGIVGFGPYISLDGFHPMPPAHRVIADSVIAVTNRTYGTSIPLVGP